VALGGSAVRQLFHDVEVLVTVRQGNERTEGP
jgi:hypothetical protein